MRISNSRVRRLGVALAATTAAALAVSGCTTNGGGDGGTGDATSGGSISVATTNAATALTSGTPETNLNTNGMVDYLMGNGTGPGSFFYLNNEFEIVPDETNGSVELVTEDPLVVRYTINPEAKWSDGTSITTTDLLLSWAIGSGYYNDATYDETSGEVTSGNEYFALAGSTTGLDTTAFPTIDEEAGTLELHYSEPFVDWNLVNLIGKPAHVFAEKADMTVEELAAFFAETPKGDPAAPAAANETLSKLAQHWNNGYSITEFPSDASLLVGAGMWIPKAFEPDDGGSMTFGLNPEWRGDKPAFEELILKFIGDANAQITALRNGEVDIIEPQPSADTLAALEEAGATVEQGNQLSYDHLDLSFTADGVFSDPAVREAFLLTIPRQQILESIVTPVNPDAEVLNSQLFVPNQSAYSDAIASNGYSEFAEPNIERATELLAGKTPTVRILYNTNNPNRVDSFLAIQASAQQAGFVIEDAGSPDWSSLLGGGDYDASIFGWISAGAGYAGLPQIWRTGGGGNYNGYSNAQVDALVDESQITIGDEARLEQIQIEIDALTKQDFYGLPLFQTPGLTATNGRVEGLEYNGGQTGVVWNNFDWTITE